MGRSVLAVSVRVLLVCCVGNYRSLCFSFNTPFYFWYIIGEGSGALIVSGGEHDRDTWGIHFEVAILKSVMFYQASGIIFAGGTPAGGGVSNFARYAVPDGPEQLVQAWEEHLRKHIRAREM